MSALRDLVPVGLRATLGDAHISVFRGYGPFMRFIVALGGLLAERGEPVTAERMAQAIRDVAKLPFEIDTTGIARARLEAAVTRDRVELERTGKPLYLSMAELADAAGVEIHGLKMAQKRGEISMAYRKAWNKHHGRPGKADADAGRQHGRHQHRPENDDDYWSGSDFK